MWLTLALRSWLSVPMMASITQIHQFYKTQEKVNGSFWTCLTDAYHLKACTGTNSKPSIKFFNIKNKFFSKSDSTSENPPDDEDDSQLDEPNLDTFPLEASLEIFASVELSLQCLASVLSEDGPTGCTAASSMTENLGEPSAAPDDDFLMEL